MNRHFRTVFRTFIPVAGIAVMFGLSEQKELFVSIVSFPLAVSLPLLIFSTARITAQSIKGQPVNRRYFISYVSSLVIPAAALIFLFMLEAAGSHGADHGMFNLKSLFALSMLVAFPLVDLALSLIGRETEPAYSGRIRYTSLITGTVILCTAAFFLIQIIRPPLNEALRLNYLQIAKTLIDSGADVKKPDRYGCTPLWYALHRVDTDMAEILMNKGAALNSDLAGLGLTRAVEAGDIDMLRLLLKNGADPDSTYMGATPLVHACLRKNMQMIRELLAGGADINFRSSFPNMPYDGKSPLDMARECGGPLVVELMLTQGKIRHAE